MYNLINKRLGELENPINIAVVGCGWFGSGLVRELLRFPNLVPKVIITRTPDKAVDTLTDSGIAKDRIVLVKSKEDMIKALRSDSFVVASDISLIKEFNDIDVVFEATGDILAGAAAALNSIIKGIHFVTVNYEMDATIGLILAKKAKEKGVIYSGSDGDQPGCLARIINEVKAMGFEPKLAGNCKGFMDFYQTPEGVKPFVPQGQNPVAICSFADGSKQSFELASVANAFGFYPIKRGMHGPKTTKQTMVKDFDGIINLGSIDTCCIEYVLGINGVDQGGGVFVIAHRDEAHVKADMDYMKKGKGPFYLFFRDHHLCYFEAASSIAEAYLFETPTLSPKGRFVDVISLAKRDITAGQKLDGIGGFDCYGMVEKADIAEKEKLLPIGLASFAVAKQNIKKDTPITFDMVKLQDNLVVNLRKEQDMLDKNQDILSHG
jgi:predicted homoserine dehydrogenase-like protein